MSAYEKLRSEAAWIDLSGRALIRVTGEDRVRLLHAMSTNDINNLAPGHSLYAFFLNAQGRMLADSYIHNLPDSFLLDTEPELRQKLFQHLDKYIIADDAVLADETEKWTILSIEGPQFKAKVSALGFPVPDRPYQNAMHDDWFSARVGSVARDGYRMFLPRDSDLAFTVREQLLRFGVPQASTEVARIVRLENGIPRYGEDLTERFLTGEAGIEHAIHTNKGCYLGQEIVERVRSRAQVHRVLKQLRINTADAPAPGTKLQAGGKDVAEVSSAVFSPAWGAVAALGYVRTEAANTRPEMTVAGSEPPISAVLV